MSLDYALWKWADSHAPITTGLCYLLLLQGVDCPEVAPLDIERLLEEIDRALPNLPNLPIVVTPSPGALLLNMGFNTPIETIEWFVDFAEREGMVFFDPQDEGAFTVEDQKEFDRRFEVFDSSQNAIRMATQLSELRAQADAGDPKALFTLGNCYSFGEGVAQDLGIAFRLFEQSAMAGYSDGMFNLAACYRSGEGTPKDVKRALAWYLRAAEKDPRSAFFAVGEIYANGETGAVERDKAVQYLQLSWDHGNGQAYRLLRSLGVNPQ